MAKNAYAKRLDAARMARGHGKKLWSSFEEVTRTAIKACELDEALSKLRKE